MSMKCVAVDVWSQIAAIYDTIIYYINIIIYIYELLLSRRIQIRHSANDLLIKIIRLISLC